MRHVVVGGGVAGVCCAEELCRLLPQDEVVLVSAGNVLKGVSTVARITRNIEELRVEEKQLDALPYPNLRMVQDIATGIDLERKVLLLGSHEPLPYGKLCICAGARPKRLPGGDNPAVIYLRDTQSLEDLCKKLSGSRRVMVVGNGAIALEAVHALRGLEVVWVMKHGHIGDAVFDLDAAQFLLQDVMQAQQAEQAQQEGQQQPVQALQPSQLPLLPQQRQDGGHHGGQPQPLQHPPGGTNAGAAVPSKGEGRQQRESAQQPGEQQGGGGQQAGKGKAEVHRGTLGHAVGPTWVNALPHAGGQSRVLLEYGCRVESIVPLDGAQPGASQQHGRCQQQAQQQAEHAQQIEGQPESSPAAGPAGWPSSSNEEAREGGGEHPWRLEVTLSNGKQYKADLIISAIGVTPALEWVPTEVERGRDGGLLVDRCMETSQPGIYAAGDSCTAAWAAEDSPHWFQMRLWTQARMMGVYAAHCMAGVQSQTGASMAFELFTHATRFMGHKVVLLGLYNGQRLQGEAAEDIVTYSRVTEGLERTFVRLLLLRGRVQGAVLIGDTDLEETMENLILDQLDVGDYGPSLLDPEIELDHVFD